MLHDSASRPDDDDVDEDDIDNEAGFQAAARLGAQLELFPELTPPPTDTTDTISFAVNPSNLRDLARVTRSMSRRRSNADVPVLVEIHGNRIRVSARYRSVTCRAVAPLETHSTGVPPGTHAFGFRYEVLERLGSLFQTQLYCAVHLGEGTWTFRKTKTTQRNSWKLELGTLPAPDFGIEAWDHHSEAQVTKFDPLVLRQGLRQLGPVTRINRTQPMYGVVQIDGGQGRAGNPEAIMVFDAPCLQNLVLRIRSEDVKIVTPILSRMYRARTQLFETQTHQIIRDHVIECVVEKPEHSFPSIEPFTSEIPTLRLYVNTLDIVREFRILSILLLVTEGDDLLAHLEYDGQTSGDLSIEVRTPLGDTKARVEACLAPGGNSGKPMKITIALRHLVPLVQWDLAKPMELTFFERQFDKDRVRRRLMLTQDTGDDSISVRAYIAGRSPF